MTTGETDLEARELFLLVVDDNEVNRDVASMILEKTHRVITAADGLEALKQISMHSFDLVLMVGLGVFGYILRKLDFPLSALILGFVLGELMEDNLRRALSISAGELSILWSSPISLCLWALTALMLALPGIRWWRARRSAQLANA